MIKTEVKYGIITGLVICLWQLSEFLLGFHTNKMNIGEFTTYFVVIIPFITIYIGIKEKRDKMYGGRISVRNGIRTGLMISLVATLIVAVYLIFYFNTINPDFLDLSIAYQKEKLLSRGKTGEQISLEMNRLKFMFSFVNQFLFGTLGLLTSGFIISFTLSLFLKKDPDKPLFI